MLLKPLVELMVELSELNCHPSLDLWLNLARAFLAQDEASVNQWFCTTILVDIRCLLWMELFIMFAFSRVPFVARSSFRLNLSCIMASSSHQASKKARTTEHSRRLQLQQNLLHTNSTSITALHDIAKSLAMEGDEQVV